MIFAPTCCHLLAFFIRNVFAAKRVTHISLSEVARVQAGQSWSTAVSACGESITVPDTNTTFTLTFIGTSWTVHLSTTDLVQVSVDSDPWTSLGPIGLPCNASVSGDGLSFREHSLRLKTPGGTDGSKVNEILGLSYAVGTSASALRVLRTDTQSHLCPRAKLKMADIVEFVIVGLIAFVIAAGLCLLGALKKRRAAASQAFQDRQAALREVQTSATVFTNPPTTSFPVFTPAPTYSVEPPNAIRPGRTPPPAMPSGGRPHRTSHAHSRHSLPPIPAFLLPEVQMSPYPGSLVGMHVPAAGPPQLSRVAAAASTEGSLIHDEPLPPYTLVDE